MKGREDRGQDRDPDPGNESGEDLDPDRGIDETDPEIAIDSGSRIIIGDTGRDPEIGRATTAPKRTKNRIVIMIGTREEAKATKILCL